MKLISGFVGAVIGGIIGAVIWAVVVKYSGWEIGWLAWGIGALVGFGFRLGAKDLANPATGVLAAAVALLAVLGGKYAVVHLYTQEVLAEYAITPEVAGSEEFVVSCIADAVVLEWEEADRPVEWPAGVDPEVAATEAEYPPEAWADAEARWAAMSVEEQQAYREGIVTFYTGGDPAGEAAFSTEVFLSSFGVFDLLWIVFAVGTAFGMGARYETAGE